MASRSRSLGSKVPLLGAVLALALAFAAMGAGVASAAEWVVEGKSFEERGLTEESAAGSGSLTVAGTVMGQPFSMNCVADFSGSLQRGGTGEATLALSNCSAKTPNQETWGICAVAPITSNPLKTEQLAEVRYERLTPIAGTQLFTFTLANCALAGVYEATGALAVLAEEGRPSGYQRLSFSAEISEAAGAAVQVGKEPASATGGVFQYLTGANSGSNWGRVGGEGPAVETEEDFLPVEWFIGNQTLSALGVESEAIGFSGGPFTFRFTVFGQNIAIRCQELTSEGASISRAARGSALWRFEGCQVLEPLCQGIEDPDINTNLLESSFLFVGGKAYEKFAPAEGNTLFTLTLTGCVLEGSYPVTGAFATHSGDSFLEVAEHGLDFSPTVSAESGTSMRFGSQPVTVEGEASQELAGSNAGLMWRPR
jgi:hypothetical protein